MDRLKTFGKYALWIILFYFFSNVLIFVGLNANYDSINSNGSVPSQVLVSQAEATAVNARIRGTITNNGEEDLNGKYMKVDLYSSRDNLLGTEYVAINDLAKDAQDDFELYFKAQDVDNYKISLVDKMEQTHNDLYNVEFLKRPLKNYEIVALLITLMIIG